jgi:hypothetical protein
MVSPGTNTWRTAQKNQSYQRDDTFLHFYEIGLLTVCGSGRISRFTEREAAPQGLPDWFRENLLKLAWMLVLLPDFGLGG